MRVRELQGSTTGGVTYETVTRRRATAVHELPLMLGSLDGLPTSLHGLLIAGDLQAREVRTATRPVGRLLGDALAERMESLAANGEIPHLDRIGVILAGDFYTDTAMERRGESGDVRSVWSAFADRFRWVAGVAGNHDMFGPDWSVAHMRQFSDRPSIHVLDNDHVELDGLTIGGISGIIGNPRRPLRRSEQQFTDAIERLDAMKPDILVMHDGPDVPDGSAKGWPSIRRAMERCAPTLAVRGHAHWKQPLATLRNGTQVLNADGRAVLLRSG